VTAPPYAETALALPKRGQPGLVRPTFRRSLRIWAAADQTSSAGVWRSPDDAGADAIRMAPAEPERATATLAMVSREKSCRTLCRASDAAHAAAELASKTRRTRAVGCWPRLGALERKHREHGESRQVSRRATGSARGQGVGMAPRNGGTGFVIRCSRLVYGPKSSNLASGKHRVSRRVEKQRQRPP
jgi:hypothetical protein